MRLSLYLIYFLTATYMDNKWKPEPRNEDRHLETTRRTIAVLPVSVISDSAVSQLDGEQGRD